MCLKFYRKLIIHCICVRMVKGGSAFVLGVRINSSRNILMNQRFVHQKSLSEAHGKQQLMKEELFHFCRTLSIKRSGDESLIGNQFMPVRKNPQLFSVLLKESGCCEGLSPDWPLNQMRCRVLKEPLLCVMREKNTPDTHGVQTQCNPVV